MDVHPVGNIDVPTQDIEQIFPVEHVPIEYRNIDTVVGYSFFMEILRDVIDEI